MKPATATAIFQTDLAAQANGAPEWVQLFPAGPELIARDGRKWFANAPAVVAAFAANNGPLPIDYEHGQDHLAAKGHEAPAAGWIVAVEDRGGEVWGKVEWTERASAMIASREYRFISPAFTHEKSGRITRLAGAGLVNRPALEMTALSRENETVKEEMMLKAIAKALGLDEGADEAAILAAISERGEERKALASALKLDPAKADQAALSGAIATLQEEHATASQRPEATEVAALRQGLDDAKTALAALKQKDTDREIEAALDQAAGEGKVTPASRETFKAMCQAEGGLERFKALAATLPVICEPTDLDRRTATAREEEIDPNVLAADARKYQDEQTAAGRTNSFSEAVFYVKEQKR